MFQEAIARQTADHFREHIEDYLEAIAASFTGTDRLTLKVPSVSSTTLVGGVMRTPLNALPALGVDCLDKQQMQASEGLCYYQYDGAIAGLVSASSSEEVDKLAKRYAAATEKFVSQHQFLVDHNTGQPYETADFMMREFIFINTTFSGAIEIELEGEEPLWIDGFTMNVLWVTSEDQYSQHIV